jgi:hypothetical protein
MKKISDIFSLCPLCLLCVLCAVEILDDFIPIEDAPLGVFIYSM